MNTLFRKLICFLLALTTLFTPVSFAGQAPLITAEDLAGLSDDMRDSHLSKINSYLSREDVVSSLEKLGVSTDDAYRRVNQLNNQELAQLANDIETAPAGGIVGAIIFVFLVLLLTDILGFTKVYPFTRSIRR